MSLITIVLLVLVLYGVQLFLQETSRFGLRGPGIVGNRDQLPELSILAGRLDRAKNNLVESLPPFLALALLGRIEGLDSEVAPGATVFLVARVLYVPAYASGVPMLRSVIWLVAVGGMLAMAVPLVGR